uniref:Uncharacterized protein n=1 Tax=Helianthus annuus TaxID=4232 RepID=A0A251VF83_HELAN
MRKLGYYKKITTHTNTHSCVFYVDQKLPKEPNPSSSLFAQIERGIQPKSNACTRILSHLALKITWNHTSMDQAWKANGSR